MFNCRLQLDTHTPIRLLFHFELFDGMVFPQIESNGRGAVQSNAGNPFVIEQAVFTGLHQKFPIRNEVIQTEFRRSDSLQSQPALIFFGISTTPDEMPRYTFDFLNLNSDLAFLHFDL